jgi:hypothetical protein
MLIITTVFDLPQVNFMVAQKMSHAELGEEFL